MPAQRASGLRGRLRAIGPQGGAPRASVPVGPNPGQMLGRLGGALRGAGSALVGAGQAAAARIPTLYAPPQAAGAAARGSRSVASVLGRVAANPRILANPYTAAAAGTLALGAWAASAGGGGGQQGRRSGGGQYFGPGYMPDAAIFPQGRGRVGGGNAGASSAADWSGGAAPVANATPVGYGAPPVVGTPAARTQRERVNEMLQNAGVQQPLPPMEDLKPFWAQAENKPMFDAAQAAGQAAQEARARGPLEAMPDTSNPASEAYWQRADIQEWARANSKLAARLREQKGLPPLGANGAAPAAAVNAFNPMFDNERIAAPAGDPAMQPRQDWADPRLRGKSEVEVAQAEVDAFQAAERADRMNRVLAMPGAMVQPAAADPRYAPGYSQGEPVSWDAAVNSKMNIPGYEAPNRPAPTAGGYGANPGVDWNAAMQADLEYPGPVKGDALEMGRGFADPEEQRRYRAGLMLNNQIQGLKRYFGGAQR